MRVTLGLQASSRRGRRAGSRGSLSWAPGRSPAPRVPPCFDATPITHSRNDQCICDYNYGSRGVVLSVCALTVSAPCGELAIPGYGGPSENLLGTHKQHLFR